jgi:hypothetical protein
VTRLEIVSHVLTNPNVSGLIEALQRYEPGMPVIIRDADTDWTINIIHIEVEDGKLVLFGEYSEMNS